MWGFLNPLLYSPFKRACAAVTWFVPSMEEEESSIFKHSTTLCVGIGIICFLVKGSDIPSNQGGSRGHHQSGVHPLPSWHHLLTGVRAHIQPISDGSGGLADHSAWSLEPSTLAGYELGMTALVLPSGCL